MNMYRRIGIIAASVLITAAGLAIAAEDLGVKIYPGATKDEQWTRVEAEVMKATGGGAAVCYRTKDPVSKVAGFYMNDGFTLTVGTVSPDGAMLQKGDTIGLTLKNMKPLDSSNDTRICIGRK
jgi:hypothetical protein